MKHVKTIAYLSLLLAVSTTGSAQDNECDPGEEPDVIVGDIHELDRWGVVGDITAFSIGTYSCNVGTCWLNWDRFTNQHPVIGQNLFRLRDGRFEQIGQSWVKHGFNALSNELCSTGCIPTTGSHLGVNCADPYRAETNGRQTSLGPKFEVNTANGSHPHPVTDIQMTGDAIYKRLQVHNDDLDPALNEAALYFVEAQYVAEDDTAAGNQHNNNSYREVFVIDAGGSYDLQLVDQTQREQPGIAAWFASDAGVSQVEVDVPADGRIIVAAKASETSPGVWHYEYAIQNLTSQRAVGSFTVPIPFQSTPANIGFHDVEYHSGEPYDGADWTPQANASEVVWQTQPFAVNPDANALRWGTLYNFRFDLAAPPESGLVTLGMFQPGSPTEVSVPIVIPKLCDDDGSCEPREDCANCLFDCPDSGPDADADTFIVCEDCNDADGDVWATPGEARNLRIMADGSLEWEPPLDPGGNVILYETLRSDDPADFVEAVTCLADANPQDTAASDGASPPVGGQFSYLVRATNVCPDGEGPLGDASSGLPREGASCP